MNIKIKAVIAVAAALAAALTLVFFQYSSSDSKADIVNSNKHLNQEATRATVSSVLTEVKYPRVDKQENIPFDPVVYPEDEEPTPTPDPEPVDHQDGDVTLPMQMIRQNTDMNLSPYGEDETSTIGAAGCYLCSLFMCGSALNAVEGVPYSYPNETIEGFATSDTYMNGESVRGPTVANALGYNVEVASTDDYTRINDANAFYDIVKNEVDSGRPLLFRLAGSWPTWHPRDSKHSMAISGYGENESGKYIVFHDPANGIRRIPLTDIGCDKIGGSAGGWMGYSLTTR